MREHPMAPPDGLRRLQVCVAGQENVCLGGGIITGGTITLGAGATALTSNSTSAVNSNVTFVTTPGTITSNAGTLRNCNRIGRDMM